MRALLAMLALAVVVTLSRVGVAQPELVPAAGGSVLRLAPTSRGLEGKVRLTAPAAGALVAPSVTLDHGGAGAPRSPLGITLEGAAVRTLAAGATHEFVVRWSPAEGDRTRFAQGFVVARTPDGSEARLGFRGDRDTTFPVLGLLVALPFLIASILGSAHFARWGRERILRRVAVAGSIAQLAVVAWIAARLDGGASRLDGNDGYGVLERYELSRSVGLEWALGLDGVSLVMLLVVGVVTLSAALVGGSLPQRAWALSFAASGAITGAVLAADARLLVFFIALSTVALALAMRCTEGGARAGALLGGAGLGACGLLGVAVQHVAVAAGPRPMVSGFEATAVSYLPELGRADVLSASTSLLGFSGVPAATTLVVAAACLLSAMGPLQIWLAATEQVAAPCRILATGAFVLLGPHVLLRVGYGVLAPGMQWAGTTLAVVGALGTVYGGLGALGTTDLRRVGTTLASASCSFAVFSLSGFTAQGIQATLSALVALAVAVVLVHATAAYVHERAGTSDARDLGGLVRAMPRCGALFGLGVLTAAGFPGTAGFAPRVAGVTGAIALHPFAALVASLGLALLALGVVRGFARAFLGAVPESWAASPRLEPHGGRFPDLRESEVVALLPAVALLVTVGLAPRAVLGFTDGASLDLAGRVNPEGPLKISRGIDAEAREIARR